MDKARKMLKRKFGVTQKLPGVFIDHFADMDNDEEKNASEKYTSALWDFAMSKEEFKF